MKFDGIRKYWLDDKDERLTGTFKIERNKRSITFPFGFSIADTRNMAADFRNMGWVEIGTGRVYVNHNNRGKLIAQQKAKTEEFYNGLLYDCLCSCGSDYNIPKSFQDFCDEFGCDNDSIKAKNMHTACLEQSALLERIFSPDEVQYLPS